MFRRIWPEIVAVLFVERAENEFAVTSESVTPVRENSGACRKIGNVF